MSLATQPVDREGNFRGRITEYRYVEGKGGSVSIALEVLITGWWDEENQQWDDDWEQYAMLAEGLICIVKNDRTVNETGVKGLVEHAGWDADMMSIYSSSWQPKPISFSVESNTYNKKTELRIGFVNGWDEMPGGRSSLTEDKAKQFNAQYGASLRALRGNAARNAAPPTGKPTPAKGPAKPRAPGKAKAPVKTEPEYQVDEDGNSILDENGNPIPF